MARVLPNVSRFNKAASSQSPLDLSLWDGVGAAIEEGIRNNTTQSIKRGIQDLFDESPFVNPEEANRQYDLVGTDMELTEGEEITESQLIDRLKDRSVSAKNSTIRSIVNQEHGFAGPVTQFISTIAASFLTDPVEMVLGMGVSKAATGTAAYLGKAATLNFSSTNRLNKMLSQGIVKYAPDTARHVDDLYNAAKAKSLTQIMKREGSEAFLGSLLSETVVFAGIGEERLSREISTQESILNIVGGTLLGGAFGAALTRDGRESIGRMFGKDYGDLTARYLDSKVKTDFFEKGMNVSRSRFIELSMNAEVFEPKPNNILEYPGVKAQNDIEPSQRTYYATVEDDTFSSYRNFDDLITLTDNPTMAQNWRRNGDLNSNVTVKSYDVSKLNILKQSDLSFNRRSDRRSLINDIVAQFSSDRKTKSAINKRGNIVADKANDSKITMSKLYDYLLGADEGIDYARYDKVRTKAERAEAARELKSELNSLLAAGGSVDDVLNRLLSINTIIQSPANPVRGFTKWLNDSGYDGFASSGRDFKGDHAYNSLILASPEKATLKENLEVPKLTDEHQALLKKRRESLLEEYDSYVRTSKGETDVHKEPGDEVTNIREDMATQQEAARKQQSEVLGVSEEERVIAEQEISALEQKKADGTITDAERKKITSLEIQTGRKTVEQVAQEQTDALENYANCKFNGVGASGND